MSIAQQNNSSKKIPLLLVLLFIKEKIRQLKSCMVMQKKTQHMYIILILYQHSVYFIIIEYSVNTVAELFSFLQVLKNTQLKTFLVLTTAVLVVKEAR